MSLERDLIPLLREHVRSIWALELLLLLKRSADRSWSVEDLVRELRASEPLVLDNLARFQRGGLIWKEGFGLYQFRPASDLLSNFCDNLESAYRERPVAIVSLIAAAEDQLQSFVDAFRFRRNEP